MEKKVYKALAAFYGANNSGTKRVTRRLMVLPEGMLGVDAMVVSEIIDDKVNNENREMITYRFVTNVEDIETRTMVSATITQWVSGFDKLGEKDIISIVCLGLNGVPGIDEIRDTTKDTTHQIRLTDIYGFDPSLSAHPDSFDGFCCINEDGADDMMDYTVRDAYNYGDIPVSILSHFVRKHVRKGDRFPSYGPRYAIKKLARETATFSGHVYAPLADRGDFHIKATEWADESIKTKDLFEGNPLRKSLDPVLVHYMVYNHMHREDPTDGTYVKALHMYITDIDKYNEEILDTIEPMVVHETQLLRDTLFKIVYSIEVITKPFTACTVIGKQLVLSPPAIVEYKTDIDNPMPYEGVACEYLKRYGYIEITDENINPICMTKGFDADYCYDSIILRTWKNMNPSEYEDEAQDSQKIEVIIARDNASHKAIIRIQDNKVLKNALYDLLTDDNGHKGFTRAAFAPAEYMLTSYDIVYDGLGESDSDERDEDDDDDDDWDEDDWD